MLKVAGAMVRSSNILGWSIAHMLYCPTTEGSALCGEFDMR